MFQCFANMWNLSGFLEKSNDAINYVAHKNEHQSEKHIFWKKEIIHMRMREIKRYIFDQLRKFRAILQKIQKSKKFLMLSTQQRNQFQTKIR